MCNTVRQVSVSCRVRRAVRGGESGGIGALRPFQSRGRRAVAAHCPGYQHRGGAGEGRRCAARMRRNASNRNPVMEAHRQPVVGGVNTSP
eukprot:9491232-Pyramimonas_sp.AAC.2